MSLARAPGEFAGARIIEHALPLFQVRAASVADEGQDVGEHTHECAHFMLILAGQYIRRNGSTFRMIRPPFLLFEPAGTTHDDHFHQNRGAFVALSVSAAAANMPDAPRAWRSPDILRVGLRLARHARFGSADAALVEGAAWELVGRTTGKSTVAPIPRWAQDAYDVVMDEAFDPELSIAAIASRAGVHPVHLARVFRRAWGCAPGELLRWRRVEKASELLASSDQPAAEVALSVGFCDQSHMVRALKAHYRITPSTVQRAAMLRKSKTGNVQAA